MTSKTHSQHLKQCAMKKPRLQCLRCGRNFSGSQVMAKIVQ